LLCVHQYQKQPRPKPTSACVQSVHFVEPGKHLSLEFVFFQREIFFKLKFVRNAWLTLKENTLYFLKLGFVSLPEKDCFNLF
jgi:hypothetical protein